MYSARITRDQKAAFVLLIDGSGSMSEQIVFQGKRMSKAEAVSQTANIFIDELVNRCKREDGVRDYFDVSVLEYSGDGVCPLLSEECKFVSVTQIARMPVRVVHNTVERRLPGGNTMISDVAYKEWVRPAANGNTPMIAALDTARTLIMSWCRSHHNRNNYPPVVINVTDGEASDGDSEMLGDAAESIRHTGTSDGNTLLFNIHIGSPTSCEQSQSQLQFPSSEEQLPDCHYAKELYNISSTLPECYNNCIMENNVGRHDMPPFKAMCYNCSLEELINMLVIGSSSVENII